jgi:hypothetical protein
MFEKEGKRIYPSIMAMVKKEESLGPAESVKREKR